jgi:hypothetical protein
MPEAVYALCFLTSVAVAILLLRGYRRSGLRLLLWCGLGFIGLCVNNLLLVVDLVLFPSVDLAIYRAAAGLLGIALMVFGLIWDSSQR